MIDEIIKYFPNNLCNIIKNLSSNKKIKEIRLRAKRKVAIIFHDMEYFIDYTPEINEMLEILINVSKNSIYAIQNDINNGFVVIPGGHRIGICGEVVIVDGKIKNIKNINSMNIRVANEILGAANKILPYVIKNKNEIRNTLIVSPPGCGKTTILRDLIRQISNGVEKYEFKGKNVGVIDERGEIAAVYMGKTLLDVGTRTDIISNCPKDIGISMLIRSMAPDIIATDEIGSKNDILAIKKAVISGVNLIFTMHAENVLDVYKRDELKECLTKKIFECIIVLSNEKGVGTVSDVKIIEKEKN